MKGCRILILSDSKPGHLNQSIGIAESVKSATYKIVTPAYRFKWGYILSVILCNLGIFSSVLMKFILKGNFYESIRNEEYDIVLSAGRSVAPLNLMIGKGLGVPSVCCMINRLLPLNFFQLMFIPFHDNPPKAGNVIGTLGAPNRINDRYLVENTGLPGFSRVKKPVISLLLGGETKYYSISIKWLDSTIKSLKGVIEELGGTILLTTSRRTPPEIESFVDKEFRDFKFTGYMLLAGKSDENPTPSFFAVSDIVLVTEDSISMISEAASSGRKVIVLKLEKRASKSPKHKKTLVEMEKSGCIKISSPETVAEDIKSALYDSSFPARVLDEAKRCADEITKLLEKGGNWKR